MQEGRLFQIVYYLLERGRATASELAEKLEVSVRTIYRDIDALSAAGIPVYAETGRNGGFCLMDHFVLDKALFSEKERKEILAALQSLKAAPNIRIEDTLGKLSAVFGVPSEDWLEVDFSGWGNPQDDRKKFETLKTAVIRRKAVQITYAGSCEKIRARKIYPLKLAYRSKAWYVKAYCARKNDYRTFKLNRILELEMLDESFSGFSFPEEKDLSQEEYEAVVLRFSGEAAYRVYDEFDRTDIARQENGDLLVSARVPQDMWLIGFLLSFGSQVEIAEPAGVRKAVAEQAKQIYEINKP
jgi:predicted DNA-binding transcriptional regulator YafY